MHIRKHWGSVLLAAAMLLLLALAAGCGGGGVKRIMGLAPAEVVKTFYDAAKNGNTAEAALYLSPDAAGNMEAVTKSLTGKLSLKDLRDANLLSVKEVARQDNYAVVVATLQRAQNSADVIVQPVGLEKINGEWYIVNPDKIYHDVKYQVLAQLLQKL